MKKHILQLFSFLFIALLISGCTHQKDRQSVIQEENVKKVKVEENVKKENVKKVKVEKDIIYHGSDDELFQRDTENYLDPSDEIFIPEPWDSYPPNPSSGEINPDYEEDIYINEPSVDYELNIYDGDMIAPAPDNL